MDIIDADHYSREAETIWFRDFLFKVIWRAYP